MTAKIHTFYEVRKSLNKDRVLNEIIDAGKAIAFNYQDLRQVFGFKRINGEEFLLIKILKPSLTEEAASYLSERQIHDNIEQFCT